MRFRLVVEYFEAGIGGSEEVFVDLGGAAWSVNQHDSKKCQTASSGTG